MTEAAINIGDKIERDGKKWTVSKVGKKWVRIDLLNEKGTNAICHHGFIIYQPNDSPLCQSVNCHRQSCFVTVYLEKASFHKEKIGEKE